MRRQARPYSAGPAEKCRGHVHHPFHPLLQEHVEQSGIDFATRDPSRLFPAFRRGLKIGGADCGLAVREQRSWKRRRGSSLVVSTIGGGGAAAEPEEMRRCRGGGRFFRGVVAHRVLSTLRHAAVSLSFTQKV